jgi:hypothetical protein
MLRLALTAVMTSAPLFTGCEGCAPARGSRADLVLWRLATWDRPECVMDEDCAGAMACPAERVPKCGPFDSSRKGFPRFCDCSQFRWIEPTDGGHPVLTACARNPDGGAPICGRWEAGHILAEDGGIIGGMVHGGAHDEEIVAY